MIEHMKKLTEEAWKLSPEEQIEFLCVLTAMVEEDGYDGDAAAVAECQHLGTISAKAWGAWVGSDRQLNR
jgi:hypothetical protein